MKCHFISIKIIITGFYFDIDLGACTFVAVTIIKKLFDKKLWVISIINFIDHIGVVWPEVYYYSVKHKSDRNLT